MKIGDKIAGFLFEVGTPSIYVKEMDEFIGKIGTVTLIQWDEFQLEFENNDVNHPTVKFWYPLIKTEEIIIGWNSYDAKYLKTIDDVKLFICQCRLVTTDLNNRYIETLCYLLNELQ